MAPKRRTPEELGEDEGPDDLDAYQELMDDYGPLTEDEYAIMEEVDGNVDLFVEIATERGVL